MYESELYILLKIILIVLAWVVFLKSEQISLSLYAFWQKCFASYMSALCVFYKFTFRGVALLLMAMSLIWLYQPNLAWLERLIY